MAEDVFAPVVKKLSSVEGVLSCAIVSRSGMFVSGSVPEGAHVETYAAMSAIIMGAGDTTATELGERFDYALVAFNKRKVLIIPLGEEGRYLASLCLEAGADSGSVLEGVKKVLKKVGDVSG